MPVVHVFIVLGENLNIDGVEFMRLAVVENARLGGVALVAYAPRDFEAESVLFALGIGNIRTAVAPVPDEPIRSVYSAPVKTAERVFLRKFDNPIAESVRTRARHAVLLRRHKIIRRMILKRKNRRYIFESLGDIHFEITLVFAVGGFIVKSSALLARVEFEFRLAQSRYCIFNAVRNVALGGKNVLVLTAEIKHGRVRNLARSKLLFGVRMS